LQSAMGALYYIVTLNWQRVDVASQRMRSFTEWAKSLNSLIWGQATSPGFLSYTCLQSFGDLK